VIAEEGRALVSLLFDASGAPYVSVQEAVATLRPLLRMVEGRNDRVTLHVDRDLETRKFSEHLRLSLIDFRRIFFNLVQNAQAAISDRGDITVRVAWSQRPRKGLIVEVQDSGVGMNQDTIARVFEIGYRQSSESEGLGLGLPVVQSLTFQAGGLVEIKSKPGEGTTFTVHFPVLEPRRHPRQSGSRARLTSLPAERNRAAFFGNLGMPPQLGADFPTECIGRTRLAMNKANAHGRFRP